MSIPRRLCESGHLPGIPDGRGGQQAEHQGPDRGHGELHRCGRAGAPAIVKPHPSHPEVAPIYLQVLMVAEEALEAMHALACRM